MAEICLDNLEYNNNTHHHIDNEKSTRHLCAVFITVWHVICHVGESCKEEKIDNKHECIKKWCMHASFAMVFLDNSCHAYLPM